jgi:hypothetical protein
MNPDPYGTNQTIGSDDHQCWAKENPVVPVNRASGISEGEKRLVTLLCYLLYLVERLAVVDRQHNDTLVGRVDHSESFQLSGAKWSKARPKGEQHCLTLVVL